jgi:ribose transport system ATP-binding protein
VVTVMTEQQRTAAETELRMTGISKTFGTFRALTDVSIHVRRGEVLALVGENGAGKSTLIKILSGAHRADEGLISLFGQDVSRSNPKEMLAKGVGVIHQELSLAPHLTVGENIFLGRLPRGRSGIVSWGEVRRQATTLLERVNVKVSPRALIRDLSIADRQMVEIAKALSQNARLLVLDEPSAVLGDQELEQLFDVVRRLATDGVAIIYISHRLDEIFNLADRVSVLRDGRHVMTADVEDLTKDELIRHMVGRPLTDLYPERGRPVGEERLRVTKITNRRLKNVSLTVKKGEIVGIAGLAGSGRTEVLRAIFGADTLHSGSVELAGRSLAPGSPRHSIRHGLGLVPEDRKDQALFLNQLVRFNVNIARFRELATYGVISTRRDRARAQRHIEQLGIRGDVARARVRDLSGGNQQKCILARYVGSQCDLLLIDEPTRGVDVGAKQEIYALLDEIARGGTSILMVSSELPEILGLSDRVLVMHEGRLVADLAAEGLTEEAIMRCATGHYPEPVDETQRTHWVTS